MTCLSGWDIIELAMSGLTFYQPVKNRRITTMSEIQNIDKNLATTAKINDQEIEFFSVRNEPFTIYGLICGK